MTRQEVEQLFRTVMDKLDGPTGLAMRFETSWHGRVAGRKRRGKTRGRISVVMGAVLGGLGLMLALASLLSKVQKGWFLWHTRMGTPMPNAGKPMR